MPSPALTRGYCSTTSLLTAEGKAARQVDEIPISRRGGPLATCRTRLAKELAVGLFEQLGGEGVEVVGADLGLPPQVRPVPGRYGWLIGEPLRDELVDELRQGMPMAARQAGDPPRP